MNENNQFVLENGNTLAFAEYGDPGGRPLFYFHGWPSSRFQGRLIHEPAAERGLRVIAADRPGMGGSTFQPNRKLLDWPPVIRELAGHLGIEKFSLLGLSGGGPYVIACTHGIPELIDRAGVVCGAPPLAEIPDRREMIWPYRALMRVRKIWPPLLAPCFHVAKPFSRLDPDGFIMRQVLRAFDREDRNAITASKEKFRMIMRSFEGSLAQGSRGIIADSDVYFQHWDIPFEKITVPIRFWHGERDHNIPVSMAKFLISKIPSARAEFFENEAHFSLPLRNAPAILDTFAGTT